MFKRLRTKLTLLYAGLFGAALLVVATARAMTLYAPLLTMIVLAGAGGIALVLLGGWGLARSLTRPILALDEATRRLERGEDAGVAVRSGDEIGRLARSFNAMAVEVRRREQRLTRLALHDAETGLPNRLALERAVEGLAGEAGGGIYVAALSVDRFAQVRGAVGDALTSALIRELGEGLMRLRPGDPVSRVSPGGLGVAFVAQGAEDARRIAQHLRSAVEGPVRLAEGAIEVGVTAGLAALGGHVEEPASLIDRAVVAVDQARAGRRKLAIFDPAAYGDPAGGLSLMGEMLAAIDAGDIFIHLQPKLDLRKGAVTGAEALVRWRHATRGLVGPADFIPLAEATGHIRPLTEHVLSLAIAQQGALQAAGYELAVSVNISGRLLGDVEFAETVLEMARGACGELWLEVTEAAVIENPELALQVIDRFAEAGLKISIDDYGRGLSSLAGLKQIRAHELKIDKAFVIGIAASQKDALLVRATADLAHGLGLKATAVGVETGAALALLAGVGCDMAQGYFIARPMILPDLIAFLERDETASARATGSRRAIAG
jgi:EAL domain-containing protein (putative c-di-GMP-specific phosphodiesterase class I)/GGDEF domain-containing protein